MTEPAPQDTNDAEAQRKAAKREDLDQDPKPLPAITRRNLP